MSEKRPRFDATDADVFDFIEALNAVLEHDQSCEFMNGYLKETLEDLRDRLKG